MFKIDERSTESCIGLRVSGKLHADDYDTLDPIVQNAIKAHGSINLVLQLADFEGYEDIDAILADVEMSADAEGNIDRVALVSDSNWQEIAAKLLDPLTTKTDLKFFETSQVDAAWTWACNSA